MKIVKAHILVTTRDNLTLCQVLATNIKDGDNIRISTMLIGDKQCIQCANEYIRLIKDVK